MIKEEKRNRIEQFCHHNPFMKSTDLKSNILDHLEMLDLKVGLADLNVRIFLRFYLCVFLE